MSCLIYDPDTPHSKLLLCLMLSWGIYSLTTYAGREHSDSTQVIRFGLEAQHNLVRVTWITEGKKQHYRVYKGLPWHGHFLCFQFLSYRITGTFNCEDKWVLICMATKILNVSFSKYIEFWYKASLIQYVFYVIVVYSVCYVQETGSRTGTYCRYSSFWQQAIMKDCWLYTGWWKIHRF